MRQMRQILMAVTVSQTLLILPPPVMSPLPVMSQHLQGVAGKSAQSSSVLREQGYAQHEGEFIYTIASQRPFSGWFLWNILHSVKMRRSLCAQNDKCSCVHSCHI